MHRPNTYIDHSFAATLIKQPSPRPTPRILTRLGFSLFWMSTFACVLLFWSALLLPAGSNDTQDFSDTGVGCIDDCLEPDEQGEPCTPETCQD